MATLKEYEKLTVKERINRKFSEDFKRKIVSELDRNLLTVAEVGRENQVTRAAIYKWIYKYSSMRKKGLKQVVEASSDTRKLLLMKEEIRELQRIIGEKQIMIEFKDKMIELAEKAYNLDIKKKIFWSTVVWFWLNRQAFKMNALYRVIGISRQSFHQRLHRKMDLQKESNLLLPQINEIRESHPRLSSRIMYGMIRPPHLGRDRFEAFCFKNGFKVRVKRSFHRTTNSWGVTRFENLLSERQVTGVNQVWVSDITYYRIREKFYYLTFILDLYSRFIVGHSTSRTLRAEDTTIPALRMALKARDTPEGMIFHSDGGGQYYGKEWLDLTKTGELRNSMCEIVYENAFAERLNGIIKNDYLAYYGPQTFDELVRLSGKAVTNYNYTRPHQSIGKLSPAQFEESLKALNVDNSRELPTSNTYDYDNN